MRRLALLLTVVLAPPGLVSAQSASPMAHDRAERSIEDLRPDVVILGDLYGPFQAVTGVYCDRVSGEVLVADAGANAIAIFDGKGAPLFSFTDDEHLAEPSRLAADADGRIYVLDSDRGRVKVFDYRGEFLSYLKLPGFEDPTKAAFTAITFDTNGDLFLGESKSGQVLVFDKDRKLKLKLGSFGEGPGQLSGIAGIAVDDANVYVASHDGVAVHVFSRRGRFLRGWGYHDAGLHNVSLPAGIAVDAKGRVILADMLRQELKYFDPDGKLIDLFGGLGTGPGEVAYPSDLSTDRNGRICVADKGNVRVQILTPIEAKLEPEATPDETAAPPVRPDAPPPIR